MGSWLVACNGSWSRCPSTCVSLRVCQLGGQCVMNYWKYRQRSAIPVPMGISSLMTLGALDLGKYVGEWTIWRQYGWTWMWYAAGWCLVKKSTRSFDLDANKQWIAIVPPDHQSKSIVISWILRIVSWQCHLQCQQQWKHQSGLVWVVGCGSHVLKNKLDESSLYDIDKESIQFCLSGKHINKS